SGSASGRPCAPASRTAPFRRSLPSAPGSASPLSECPAARPRPDHSSRPSEIGTSGEERCVLRGSVDARAFPWKPAWNDGTRALPLAEICSDCGSHCNLNRMARGQITRQPSKAGRHDKAAKSTRLATKVNTKTPAKLSKAPAKKAAGSATPKGYNPLSPDRVREILNRLESRYHGAKCALIHSNAWE